MGGSSLAELAARVEALFARADGETEAFRKRSGLACPPGCGACCESEEVTATPLEFLPLALELLRRGEAALWLERLGADPPPARCLFYHRDPARPGHGRCTVHRWRPLLCRLFGFAGVPDRTGRPRLAACKLQRLALPGLVARAEALACPSFRSFSMEASALDGPLGTRLLPVHEALREALERAALHAALRAAAQDGDSPTRPLRPAA